MSQHHTATRLARTLLAVLIPVLLLSLILLGVKASSASEPARPNLPARNDPTTVLQASSALPDENAGQPVDIRLKRQLLASAPANVSPFEAASQRLAMAGLALDANRGPAVRGVTTQGSQRAAAPSHLAPAGVRVYDHDVDCNGYITYTPVTLPYEEIVYGPFSYGDLGPTKDLYICSDGGDFYIKLEADALGAQLDYFWAFLTSVAPTPPLNIDTSAIVYWKTRCWYGSYLDTHQTRQYEGVQSLQAGKYYVGLAAKHLFSWCEGSPRPFSRLYFDIDSPHAPTSQNLAPEHCSLRTNCDKYAADPGNTHTGNLTHQEVDFSIPTGGEPLIFERSYNALDSASSSLGRGWTHNYNMHLFTEYGNMVVVAPHGSRLYFGIEADGTFTPKPGVRASLQHNANGTYTLARDDQLIYTFDSNGLLSQIADSNGNATTMVYSGTLLTQVIAPGGRTLDFLYDAQGHLTQVTDPLGRTFTYGYTDVTSRGYPPTEVLYSLLTVITNPLTYTTTYSYDIDGYLAGITDAQDHTVNNAYEEIYGRLITQTDPLGHGTFFAFDNDTQQTAITDPRDNQTTAIPVTAAVAWSLQPESKITRPSTL